MEIPMIYRIGDVVIRPCLTAARLAMEAARATRDPAALKCFGLLSMRDRAQLAGGRFSITSGAGLGTRIEAWFPW